MGNWTTALKGGEPSGWRRWLSRSRRARRLRMVETLPLGERRMVAIVAVDGHEMLIGATLHSMQLLAELPDAGASAGAGLDAGLNGGER